jgi:hypothetical protein
VYVASSAISCLPTISQTPETHPVVWQPSIIKQKKF